MQFVTNLIKIEWKIRKLQIIMYSRELKAMEDSHFGAVLRHTALIEYA